MSLTLSNTAWTWGERVPSPMHVKIGEVEHKHPHELILCKHVHTLQEIHAYVDSLYDSGERLSHVINGMIEDLEDPEMDSMSSGII